LFEKWDRVVELCNNYKGKLAQACVEQAQGLISESSAGDEALRLKAADAIGQLEIAEFDVRSFLKNEVVKAVEDNEVKIIQVEICQKKKHPFFVKLGLT
jgi:hypothetical protein